MNKNIIKEEGNMVKEKGENLVQNKRKALHEKANLNDIYVKNSNNIMIYIKRAHKLFS